MLKSKNEFSFKVTGFDKLFFARKIKDIYIVSWNDGNKIKVIDYELNLVEQYLNDNTWYIVDLYN